MGRLLSAILHCLLTVQALGGSISRTFTIENDVFVRDGKPFRLLSGSLHYHRIHPEQWRDRMLRVQAMGLNAISVYVPWNLHEPYPGKYSWEGFADLERYLQTAQDLGLLVLLRPGPYICAEWDFGGFPWWLAREEFWGPSGLGLRTSDPRYLHLVDRWFDVLLPKVERFMYQNGGPVVLTQIENEFGYLGNDVKYLRHLLASVRTVLGPEPIVYTTDPPTVIGQGSIWGADVFSTVDFGAGWFSVPWAFEVQAQLNAPGKSAPMCSEFYTGWLTKYGEVMANTSVTQFLTTLNEVLDYGNSTGSLNMYMAHGGTNFGWTAGGSVDGQGTYWSVITSYDYDAPISEAGDYAQPGIDGPNKYELIRGALRAKTGVEPPPTLPRPHIVALGRAHLSERATLLGQLPNLYPGSGIYSERPRIMEEYGQGAGLLVYQTRVPAEAAAAGVVLDFRDPVHDAASILVEGELVGRLERNGPASLRLNPATRLSPNTKGDVVLSVIVETVGRSNVGWQLDTKGLVNPNVRLNGTLLEGFHAFPLPLEAGQLGRLRFPALNSTAENPEPATHGPTFYRGFVEVAEDDLRDEVLPDSYLSVRGWGKGVIFINGFNLGWFWPTRGPATTLYVPGPLLRRGQNEVIVLEVQDTPRWDAVEFVAEPDFYGPPSFELGGVRSQKGQMREGSYAERAAMLTRPAHLTKQLGHGLDPQSLPVS